MSKNDITGDDIKSKSSNQAYESGYDRIFGVKERACQTCDKWIECGKPDHCCQEWQYEPGSLG